MAGLSEKEAAFLALARAELAKKSAGKNPAAPLSSAADAAAPDSPAAAPNTPVAAAPVVADPLERIAALIEAERAATAARRDRQRTLFLGIPAAIALLAAIWILIRLLLRR